MEVMPYCLNIRDCQLEVKLSVAMYETIRMMPMSCVFFTGAFDSWLRLELGLGLGFE